jgi:hypothetical protein
LQSSNGPTRRSYQMKTKSLAALAGTATVGLMMFLMPISGQPMYDRIHVNLPYTIMLGEKTLQPGDYTIQRLPDNGGGGRVLLFYTDNGMKFETSALTIPALDPDTARDTKLVLGHVGEDYYIQKIWVQGKDYGYELPMPKGLESRQKEMTQTTVAANSMPAAASTETTSTGTPAAQTAPVNTQPEPQPATPPVATQPDPQPATPPAQTEPTTQPATQPATTPVDSNSADRAMPDQAAAPATTPTEMPHTAANWLMMLLSGGTLSGAGLMLRRKR